MTGPQRSYLETLTRETGLYVPDGLTKAEASELIDQLQRQAGRGPSEHNRRQPAVDDLIERGIVDQQAAADVAPERDKR